MEKIINFFAEGLTGDFINSMCACKNICLRDNAKANLYISEGSNPFRYGVKKAFEDTYEMAMAQEYINQFQILPKGFSEPIINLNIWRAEVHGTYHKHGYYNKCWTELMATTFDYPIKEYKWISLPPIDINTMGRIVVHRSRKRHNEKLKDYIDKLKERVVFVTCDKDEYDNYEFKNIADLHLVKTISEMAIAIRSGKLFIGNQSAPFALASAMDVERVCELDLIDAPFYIGEKAYSKKITLLQ